MTRRLTHLMMRIGASLTLGIVLSLFVVARESDSAENATANRALPGLQTGEAPWAAEIPNLLARLKAINLPALHEEGNALHIHQHLDLFVNGKPVTVPKDIGINFDARFISPLHTHDRTGIIHVESDKVRDFTLGQFFDVWGVRFTKDCVGGYCAKGSDKLRVFSNGKAVTGDPRRLVLTSHQEIAVVYGPEESSIAIPSSYNFDEGL
ncbi:MAG TPA: hypothetical protein VMO00_11105 [Methylomirabilota bacterium]|nr:hypothetical protein [Methylomirabilota bacterium]